LRSRSRKLSENWAGAGTKNIRCLELASEPEIWVSSPQTGLESRHLVDEIPTTSKEYRLVSSTSWSFLPVNEVMLQFQVTSYRWDCHLHVAFQSLRAESLCAVPIRFPRRIEGAKWSLQLWIAHGVNCLVEQAHLPQARAQSLVVMCPSHFYRVWVTSPSTLNRVRVIRRYFE